MPKIANITVADIRFPTSQLLDGSDAMNADPDYSASYVRVSTDADDGIEGAGLTFTIGRGNEVVCAAVRALCPLVIGRNTEDVFSDMGSFWRLLTADSQLRWIGPEKGAMHLALAAVVNAVWDLFAKTAKKPLWKLLSDFSPEEIVALVPFRYLSDALTPDEALDILRQKSSGRAEREQQLLQHGLPAYTTSAGWLGYDDDKLRSLSRTAVDEGWNHVKIKVGLDAADDLRRAGIVRDVIGWDRRFMVDANQVWEVGQAIDRIRELDQFDVWWVEEPTSPDDVLGHATIARAVAPTRVATGEHVQNRIVFKQLLQSGALGVCQLDAARLGGVNEVIAVMLLAEKFGVPVCPHAGGVGLCEYVQHLSAFNFIAVSANLDDVVVEYVDHLHEHFIDPVRVNRGRYLLPAVPGYSAEMHARSVARYSFPMGEEWKRRSS